MISFQILRSHRTFDAGFTPGNPYYFTENGIHADVPRILEEFVMQKRCGLIQEEKSRPVRNFPVHEHSKLTTGSTNFRSAVPNARVRCAAAGSRSYALDDFEIEFSMMASNKRHVESRNGVERSRHWTTILWWLCEVSSILHGRGLESRHSCRRQDCD